MATSRALADRSIVSLVLHHLSDMKYKDRRQSGPDQPVEFLEFRPTLVPSILVNKLWADEGTSVLWKRYPHLPAMAHTTTERQQWYANKVERLFVLSPSPDSGEDLVFLKRLDWPKLKYLELEVDWKRHGSSLQHMLHANLEHLEISTAQSGGSTYIAETLLLTLINSCKSLRSIHFGHDAIDSNDPIHHQVLRNLLEEKESVTEFSIMNANFFGKDLLFRRLSQRAGLEALEIDLDPGLQLLPLLQEPTSSHALFLSLHRLHVMCYPEIALALPAHLLVVEKLSLDIARIPDCLVQDSDPAILNGLLSSLVQCPKLQQLKVNIGQLATDFPSIGSLPGLNGASLIEFATACSNIKDISLLASEPAAIDASNISSAQFEQFCQLLPHLTNLSLKLHPRTTMALEDSALHCLGRHCPQLEVLRLKVALQLPSLLSRTHTPSTAHNGSALSSSTSGAESNLHGGAIGDIEVNNTGASLALLPQPLFPNLGHLALARPQTVLSVAASTYAASMTSKSSSTTDPWLEEELVRCWAHSLLQDFPRLDILEAWSDWTGQDNDSLNYFLPLEEPLASTWEFLSGIEQDLWDDGEDGFIDESERWNEDFEEGISIRGSGDWDRASLINEFPDMAGSGCRETYEEEPEDMVTPVDGRQHWLTDTNGKLVTPSTTIGDISSAGDLCVYDLDERFKHITLHPLADCHQQA